MQCLLVFLSIIQKSKTFEIFYRNSFMIKEFTTMSHPEILSFENKQANPTILQLDFWIKETSNTDSKDPSILSLFNGSIEKLLSLTLKKMANPIQIDSTSKSIEISFKSTLSQWTHYSLILSQTKLFANDYELRLQVYIDNTQQTDLKINLTKFLAEETLFFEFCSKDYQASFCERYFFFLIVSDFFIYDFKIGKNIPIDKTNEILELTGYYPFYLYQEPTSFIPNFLSNGIYLFD